MNLRLRLRPRSVTRRLAVVAVASALVGAPACSDDLPDRDASLVLMNEAMVSVRDSLVAGGVTPAQADSVIGRFNSCVYARMMDNEDELRALTSADDTERINVIQRNTEECQQIITDAVTSTGQ